MKKKFNPELLKEELNRFRLLNEYDFYQEKKEVPEYKDLDEADEPDDAADVDDAADAVAGDLGVDAGADGADAEGETTGDIPEPDADGVDFGNDGGDDFGGDAEMTDTEPAPMEQPDANEEEIDVTSLVKGAEEAKLSADHASHNTEMLMHKLDALEAHVANMDKIGAKIEDLEKEIIKRNPTPVEKLEMRSLDSYPFNQKLSDYWKDKEGAYDVMGNKNKKREYILTQKDVDKGYTDSDIKKSFTVNNDGYEEEDIDGYEEENI